jgi:hypothetical protein
MHEPQPRQARSGRARRRPGSVGGGHRPVAGQLPAWASTRRRRYLSASENCAIAVAEFLHLQVNTSCRLGITKMLSAFRCPIAANVSAGADGQLTLGWLNHQL